jgi:hypothetical protein
LSVDGRPITRDFKLEAVRWMQSGAPVPQEGHKKLGCLSAPKSNEAIRWRSILERTMSPDLIKQVIESKDISTIKQNRIVGMVGYVSMLRRREMVQIIRRLTSTDALKSLIASLYLSQLCLRTTRLISF